MLMFSVLFMDRKGEKRANTTQKQNLTASTALKINLLLIMVIPAYQK